MKYRLMDSLGLDDARRCNKDFGAALPIHEPKLFTKGCVIELPKEAADFLTKTRGLTAILEVSNIRGDGKQPEIAGSK